ncbi:MAG: hypothetical protein EOM64_08820 [Erysipelotrichia bacterium]|nr:hypothetical protein [Erysipelotrichia bacterium]
MLWQRAARVGMLLGAAYMLGKSAAEQKDSNATDAEFTKSSSDDRIRDDAEDFINSAKDVMQQTAESARGYADALISEFNRQTKK